MRRLVAGFVTAALFVPLALFSTPTVAQAAPGEFQSSFESTDPPITWTNTVETDRAGRPRAANVNSAFSTGIPGNISDKIAKITASAENTGGGEVKENLADGDVHSKWLAFAPTGWVQYELSEPMAIVKYGIASANDEPTRDPKDWKVEGSTDGSAWTTVDSRSGESFSSRFQMKQYDVANTTAYKFYRLTITANAGADILQASEWQLAIDPKNDPPLPNMQTSLSTGPASAPAAKANVGFTGLHSLRYAGTQTAAGRGFSYNKIFDVSVPVNRDTSLSYLLFPELTGDDLRYSSTFVAVDLAFSDGSYLSSLGAVDQHGVRLDPVSQGSSKAIYANQWNNISADIGKVAAGKRIVRILLGYDSPNGAAMFRGWVDDITISGHPARKCYQRPSDYVVTTRGTQASGNFSRGNNFPATAVPHGFNFWTPVTNAGSTSWLYEYNRANDAQNLPELQAFSLSHEPSPWMGDRQTFQVMPSVATDTGRTARALPFRHADEVASPDYYGVKFTNGVRTELTPTDHAAVFRFSFPGTAANLIFDNVNNGGGLTFDPAARTLTGYSDVKSGLSIGAGRIFVYATFDKAVTGSGKAAGSNVAGYLSFGSASTVTMRIATSLISVAQARKNLDLEVGSASFERVRAAAKALWDAKLSVIEVSGASTDQLTTLYSNLYRLFLYPNSGFENTGTAAKPVYRYASPTAPRTGADTPTETGSAVRDGKVYVNNGFWDTYRTTWPAYSLLTPKDAGEMIGGFLQLYADGGWVPRWSSPGYANLMTGTSSDVAFADAYLKGVDNFDVKAAYDAALRNATVTPPNESVGRKGLASSIFLGYTPTSTGEGMSWAMEGYVNDFGIANLSKALYDRSSASDPRRSEYLSNYRYFRNRAQNYVHMFDKSVGFFQGRKADGTWNKAPEAYDPRDWGGDYTETNGWGMAFTVPQDGQGLANLYGGRAGLGRKLDQFFSTPETATHPGSYGGVIHEMTEARDVRMGQYGHSNQPSHHIIYMYDYAGQPSKTQALVREALSRLYIGSEIGQGYPGDEDNGEMSAWQIFGSLGFYPLQMGSPSYAIGSPLYKRAVIHLQNGRQLVVDAPNNSARNVYVQGLRVNGKPWDRTYLPADLLSRGGTLDFVMGPTPSRWGTSPSAAPPSITTGDAVPTPWSDKLTSITSDDGTDVSSLVDNTTATRATFASATPTLTFGSGKAAAYTLTSGAVPGDPKSWVLEGSSDGTHWTAVDTQTNQTFAWRLQTRAFALAHPADYSSYRLRITESTGSTGTLSLAEVELLS
ncbi:GH92 family glycosyl hydrolase [Fodinicola acaciae]|uniref:GH92 family glycosyl hydrolase n=1 Tax=Fodinicola acaciae TaxID=2681555 RepID=UPI001C9E3C2F|nr:GH92 family glycosyl hydrolase [Fodinicola acaciae]